MPNLAERYHALTPAQEKVAGARYLELVAENCRRSRDACWAEAIEEAELIRS
jgi:hypothetical protein